METLLEKVIMNHIDTWTPEKDRPHEKFIVNAALDLHKEGKMTAYQVLELYGLHRDYFPGQN